MPKLKVKVGLRLAAGQEVYMRPLAFPNPNLNPVTPSSMPEGRKVRVRIRTRLM